MPRQQIHHERRSLRYPGWDYSAPAGYFVTVCTHEREHLFGEIQDGEMLLNELGTVVAAAWLKTSEMRLYVDMDAFVVMPNHFHGIVWLTSHSHGRGVLQYAPTVPDGIFRSPSIGIGAIVRGWKSTTAKQINEIRGSNGTKVWQRSYHDRIIRDTSELFAIRRYIQNNPKNWESDEYSTIKKPSAHPL